MILQLSPTMPLLTPHGPALAHFLIDYGEEHHLFWVCIINETGEIWTFPNHKVRAESNITFDRPHIPEPPYEHVSKDYMDDKRAAKRADNDAPVTGHFRKN